MAKTELTEEQKEKYKKVVYALVSTQLFLESIDEIKDLEIYKMQIKKSAKYLEKELEVIVGKTFKEIFFQDEWAFRELSNNKHSIIKWLATAPNHHINELGRAIGNDELNFMSREEYEALH